MDKEELNKIFRYDRETGKLYWKVKIAYKVVIGKEAGNYSYGYRQVRINKKLYPVHRIIWTMNFGDIPKNLQMDHINGIRDDNRLENLRLVTHKENGRNQKLNSCNISGIIGIGWAKRENRWRARIYVDDKDIHLGYFINKQDAIKARKEAEKKYNFHKNHGRGK